VEEYRRVMGFVSHTSYLYVDLTPRENLSFFGKLFGLAEGNKVGEELLEFFGLGGRADDPVRHLSRGLQQRVSLARALIHDPEILLLDEPFTGLDEGTVKLLIERLRTEKAKGKCILVATHSFERGAAVADRLVRLDAGRVVSDGPVSLEQRTASY
jgi:heme exporter protein A